MSDEYIIEALKFNEVNYLSSLMGMINDLKSGAVSYEEVAKQIREDLGPVRVGNLLLGVRKLMVNYPKSEQEKIRVDLLNSILKRKCTQLGEGSLISGSPTYWLATLGSAAEGFPCRRIRSPAGTPSGTRLGVPTGLKRCNRAPGRASQSSHGSRLQSCLYCQSQGRAYIWSTSKIY